MHKVPKSFDVLLAYCIGYAMSKGVTCKTVKFKSNRIDLNLLKEINTVCDLVKNDPAVMFFSTSPAAYAMVDFCMRGCLENKYASAVKCTFICWFKNRFFRFSGNSSNSFDMFINFLDRERLFPLHPIRIKV